MRSNRLRVLILLQAVSLAFSGSVAFCQDFAGRLSPAAINESDFSKGGRTLAMKIPTGSSSTNFALKLFSAAPNKANENVLVSPFSAFAALSMTLNGASGMTRQQMAGVLGINAGAVDELNQKNKALFAALNANKDVRLEIANAIYADSRTPFEKSFIELCRNFYGAEVHNADFADPATVKAINSWCETKTHGKIDKILDQLTPLEKMVLLNAIYFKGTWLHQFTKAFTKDDKFTLGSGEQIPVKMMHQLQDCLYYKGNNFAAVSLPYVGQQQSMFIFLPDHKVDLAALQAGLTQDNWTNWMQAFRMADIDLSVPRFKISYSARLNDALASMGMPDAFVEGSADFSNMIKQPTLVSRVLQKTYMDVNEEGTEAAAVTAVVMATRCAVMRPEPVVEFRVDRPFIAAIVDNQSKEILFIGTIVKP